MRKERPKPTRLELIARHSTAEEQTKSWYMDHPQFSPLAMDEMCDALESTCNDLGELLGAQAKILNLIRENGSTDGAHHKDWLLDQIVRLLTEDGYEAWVAETKAGEDGPETYSYSTGIAP